MHELFGDLRSWMQDPQKRFEEIDAFYAFLANARATIPAAFIEQWTSYLRGYELPPLEIWGLEDLRAARPYLPSNTPLSYHFSRVGSAQEFDELLDLLDGLWLRHVTMPTMEDAHIARLAAREHLLCVESLVFDFNIVSARAMARLLDGDAIAGLKSLELRNIALDAALSTCIASAPGLEALERLMVRSTTGGHGLARKLAASDQMTSLRRVELELHHTDGDSLATLHGAPWFAQLEHLDLSNNNPCDDTIAAIARASAEGLHTLRLRHHYAQRSRVSEQALAILFDSPQRANLITLDLGGHGFEHEALELASRAKQMRALRALDLSHNRIAGGEISARAMRENLPALTCLRLQDNDLGDDDCDFFDGLPDLRELNLGRNHITARGIASIVASEAARAVEKLGLFDNELGEEGLSILASAKGLLSLTQLDVSNNAIEDVSISALARAEWFADMEVLQFSSNALTNASVEALCEADFSRLRVLDLNYNAIDDRGAMMLLDAPWLVRLTHLGIAPLARAHIPQLSDDIRERFSNLAKEHGITRLITRYNRSILYPWRDALTISAP